MVTCHNNLCFSDTVNIMRNCEIEYKKLKIFADENKTESTEKHRRTHVYVMTYLHALWHPYSKL